MDLEFIDISQRGEERRASGSRSRNYVSGSAVRAERPVPRYNKRVYEADRPVRRSSNAGRRANAGQRPRPRTPEEIEQRRQRILQKKKRQRQRRMVKGFIMLFETAFIVLLCFLLYHFIRSFQSPSKEPVVQSSNIQETGKTVEESKTLKPTITEDFLTVNPYSRPGEKLESVNNVFVHYTANKGTSAAQNRSYFENLGITGETSASAHFIIGSEGEIIQCVPLDEIAYAVMKRNYDSVSIECCYLDDDGEFTYATYMSLVRLCAWLLDEYNLSPADILRHYDEGGKKCPLYFVEHEDKWEQFKKDVEEYMLNEPTV